MSNLKVYEEISKILKGRKMTSYALQEKMQRKGMFYSESTLTRRMREMDVNRTPPPKGKKVNGKRVTAWTYSL